jgi:hypothetical protein
MHPVVRLGFPAVTAGKRGEEQRGAVQERMGAVIGVDRNVVIEAVEFDDDADEIVVSGAAWCGSPLRRRTRE